MESSQVTQGAGALCWQLFHPLQAAASALCPGIGPGETKGVAVKLSLVISKASPAMSCCQEPAAPASAQSVPALSGNLHAQIPHPGSMPASPCKHDVVALCLDPALSSSQPPVDQGWAEVLIVVMGCWQIPEHSPKGSQL